jgi:hypothetical protein
MLTVFWNPDGFHVVTILQRAASLNRAWFIDGNLVPWRDQFVPGGRRLGQKKLMIHIDNGSAILHRWPKTFSCITDSASSQIHLTCQT